MDGAARHTAFLLTTAALLTMTACAVDAVTDGDEYAAQKEQVLIHFTINTAGSSTQTRTTWGDSYTSENATYNENAIDADKFSALVFGVDGACLGELCKLSYYTWDTENNLYEVEGMLLVDKTVVKANPQCKLVILANYDDDASLTGISSLSGLKEIAFAERSHMTADIAAGTAFIPMFGVKTFTMNTADYRNDVGTICLLRALAKIRIELDNDSNNDGSVTAGEELAITSATLTCCNESGYIAPKGCADADKTEDLTMVDLSSLNWADDYTFNPYPSNGTPTTETLTLQKESGTLYYLYVPEYDISGGRPQFSIKFDGQTDGDSAYTFDFDQYDDKGKAKGADYHIERNHVYSFTIKNKKGTFTVTPSEWTNTFDNEYEFGNDV